MNLLARTAIILAAALIPPLGAQVLNDISLANAQYDESVARAQREADGIVVQLNNVFDEVRLALNVAAHDDNLTDADAPSCAARLVAVAAASRFLRDLRLLTQNGEVLCQTGNPDPMITPGSATASTQIGVERADPAHATLTVTDHLPSGRVLRAGVALGWLQEQFDKLNLPKDREVTVIDRDGVIVAALPDATRDGSTLPQAQLAAVMPYTTDPIPPDGPRPDEAASSWRRTANGLFIHVALNPATPPKAGLTAIMLRGYKLTGLSLLAGLALAAVMIRSGLLRPVRSILAATERWNNGDTTARVGVGTPRSEFGYIAQATNALLDALQRTNADLERRVAKRTAELEAEVREREAAQAQLQQAQKMEVVGQLTSGVAHDFNNLLTALIGNLELATMRAQDRPELLRPLQAAMRSAVRGASLSQRILAFSRRQFLRFQPVSLASLLAGMDDLLTRSIGARITVRVLAPASLRKVYADPNQLELVVLNLVVNARDAMPDGGVVSIMAAEEHIGDALQHVAGPHAGDYIRLSVSDTGTGMPPDVIAHAFEPFFTTKPVGRGSGLGLSMVQGVALQCGGAAAIDSVEGEGTTISLWLPCFDDTVKATPDGAETVLLVDGDANALHFVGECLEQAGYKVERAVDGKDALALLRSRVAPPDVLIADLAISDITGLQLAAEARRLFPAMPLLFTADQDRAAGARETAGLPVLVKPFSKEALLTRVSGLVG